MRSVSGAHPTLEFPYGGKYCARVHETIVEAIRKGNAKMVASQLAGLSQQTVFDWVAAGRKNPEKYPLWVQLEEDINRALAEYEAERVAVVTTAADTGTWQAAAWWLERRRPEDWGKQDRVKVEDTRPPVQLNQLIVGDVKTLERSRETLRELAAGGSDVPLWIGDGGESVTEPDRVGES